MSIPTPLGVYSPTRLLQGGTDAGNHYQVVTQGLFQDELGNELLQWLDDFLLHCRNEAHLLASLRTSMRTCKQYGLKIHAEKSDLYATHAHFCGRDISSEGVSFAPKNLDVILRMNKPTYASELQQLLSACNWMRTSHTVLLLHRCSTARPPRKNLQDERFPYQARHIQNLLELLLGE